MSMSTPNKPSNREARFRAVLAELKDLMAECSPEIGTSVGDALRHLCASPYSPIALDRALIAMRIDPLGSQSPTQGTSGVLIHMGMQLARRLNHRFVTVEHLLAEWALVRGLVPLHQEALGYVVDKLRTRSSLSPSGAAMSLRPSGDVEPTRPLQRVVQRMLRGQDFVVAIREEAPESWASTRLARHGCMKPVPMNAWKDKAASRPQVKAA